VKSTDMLELAPRDLQTACGSLDDQIRDAFLTHVRGGTSAAWLADWSSRAGVPVAAETIRAFRERLNAQAGKA
jgi:hypothetical protein